MGGSLPDIDDADDSSSAPDFDEPDDDATATDFADDADADTGRDAADRRRRPRSAVGPPPDPSVSCRGQVCGHPSGHDPDRGSKHSGSVRS